MNTPYDDLHTQGFATVRQVIDEPALTLAQQTTLTLIAQAEMRWRAKESGATDVKKDGWQIGPIEDGGEALFRLNSPWLRHRMTFAAVLMSNATVRHFLQWFFKEETPRLVSDALVFKYPGKGFGHRWHTDPSPGPDARSLLIGVHLDESGPATRGMRYITATRPNQPDWRAMPRSEWYSSFPGVVSVNAKPGDLTLHRADVLHGSRPTSFPHLRRIYWSQWAGEWEVDRISADKWNFERADRNRNMFEAARARSEDWYLTQTAEEISDL